jgi:hypothetical protein
LLDVVSFLEVGTVEPSSTNEFIMRAYQLDKIDMSILYNATITNSFSLPLPGVFGKPNLMSLTDLPNIKSFEAWEPRAMATRQLFRTRLSKLRALFVLLLIQS